MNEGLNMYTNLFVVIKIYGCLGVSNLAALGNVVMWQRMDYDFEYHTQMFFTDLTVLVLSEGKSLLKVRVKLCFSQHYLYIGYCLVIPIIVNTEVDSSQTYKVQTVAT